MVCPDRRRGQVILRKICEDEQELEGECSENGSGWEKKGRKALVWVVFVVVHFV